MRVLGIAIVVALGMALATLHMLEPLVSRFVFQPTRGVDLRPETLGIEAEDIAKLVQEGVV